MGPGLCSADTAALCTFPAPSSPVLWQTQRSFPVPLSRRATNLRVSHTPLQSSQGLKAESQELPAREPLFQPARVPPAVAQPRGTAVAGAMAGMRAPSPVTTAALWGKPQRHPGGRCRILERARKALPGLCSTPRVVINQKMDKEGDPKRFSFHWTGMPG